MSPGAPAATGPPPGAGERLARAALSRVGEPGVAALAAAVREAGAEAVWRALREGAAWPGAVALPEAVRAAVAERVPTAEPERDLARLDRVGGRFLVPGDAEWPDGVDDLAGSGDAEPLGLWVVGPLDLRLAAARGVSVVGSRAATAYGQHVAGELGAQLADRGWSVVSGAAYGVDGAAHRGALAAGGGTVAVLACGVDVAYPRGHASLLRRVAADGLVVSEWPPGCAPQRHRFLTRNRVIAAMTAGTVVVEAGLRSGARSTARVAGSLGRRLMALPGPVTSATSAGCHVLLRDGARLVTSAEEVVEELSAVGEAPAAVPRGPGSWRDALSDAARRVLDAVPLTGPAGPAQIARVAGVDQLTVLRCLGPLEREGLVVSGPGGWAQPRGRSRRRGGPGSGGVAR